MKDAPLDGAEFVDLFIIGCGIARDAAGRGLSVALAEMNDLASATSSASTKLFHGGLRYLEYFEFRLVREALKEREILLAAMPHISWPMRFVLPYHKDMRFEGGTPTSRLLGAVMLWMHGRRPAWLIRFGLFLYSHLGGRKFLPPTSIVDLAAKPEGSACGADIMTRTRVKQARRDGELWEIILEETDSGRSHVRHAKMLVNAAGPWVERVIRDVAGIDSREGVRLVRGSHIVTHRLYEYDKCYAAGMLRMTSQKIYLAIC